MPTVNANPMVVGQITDDPRLNERNGWQPGIAQPTFFITVGGAPAAGIGANGDFAFRLDGTAQNALYQRRAGAWVELSTGLVVSGGSLVVGSGTTITQISTYSPSLTPAAAAASIGYSEQTFTVTGLATNDKVFVNPPNAPTTNIDMTRARVSATNTLALTFFNATAAANTPIAGTYTVVAIRS